MVVINFLDSIRLKYYRTAAETSFCLLDYEKMSKYLYILATKAISDLDLVPSHILQVHAFNLQLKYADAFKLCLRVLDDMGEKIPSEPGDDIISKEINENIFQHTLKMTNINDLNVVQDETVLAKFQVLHCLFMTTFFHAPRLLPLIGGRIIKLTCEFGRSKWSAIGLATAGRMFCSSNSFENGFLFGRLALSMIDGFKAKDLYPKVAAYVHVDIFFYKMPIHQMLEGTMDAMAKSFEIGDNEFCGINFSLYYCYSFYCGKPLQDLMDEFESISHKIPRKSMSLISTYQSILNLLGHFKGRKKAWLLCGKYFDYKRDIDFNSQPNHATRGMVQCIKMAYIFNEYNKAREWLELCRSMERHLIHSFQHTLFVFYDGLVYAEFAKRSKEEYYLRRIQTSIGLLQTLSTSCPQNFSHKLALLEAELVAINAESNNDKSIAQSYDKAISLSKENGFIHETALACERAGITFLSSDHVDPRYYFHQAIDSYKLWGAKSKIEQIKTLYPTLLSDQGCPNEIIAGDIQLENLSTVSKLSNTL